MVDGAWSRHSDENTGVLSENLRGGLLSCFEYSHLQQRWLSKLIADACALGLF